MRFGQILCAASIAILAGCAQLPGVGPSTGEITSESNKLEYALVPIDARVVAVLKGRFDVTFAGSFGGARGGASEILGVGDIVRVTVWEAANGGLFSTGVSDSGGSKSTTIPEQPVSQDGSISIPYAGRIEARGRTAEQVKRSIETALTGKAIEPQVLVSVTKSVFNTATVTGSVTSGGRVPLSIAGDRVLDVVAAAGGLSAPVHEVFVQLARGDRTVRVPMQRIIDNPRENVIVRPGDTITLVQEPQTFIALGATGQNSEVRFTTLGLTLAEALAKAGGLLDQRSDPRGVFIFRKEPRAIVAALDPQNPLLATGADEIAVIYQLNLREPSGLFLAREFPVFNKDLVYVTNAPLNQLQKFLELIGAVVQPVRTGASLAGNFD